MEKFLALRIYKVIAGILGIFSNGLVCLVIWRVSALHTRTNAFIFHQAVVDFLGSALIVLDSEIPSPDTLPDNVLGTIICCMWTYHSTLFTLYFVSTYSLLVLTMERYFAIVHPFKYQAAFSSRPELKVGLAIAACWVVSATLVPFAFILFEFRNGECRSVPGLNWIGILSFFITYLLPVAVMLFAYIRTSVELKRAAARVGPSSGQAAGMTESLLRARRNTFKTLLIVFGIFLICWTPNTAMFLMFNLGLPLQFKAWYYLLSVALVASNSCVNPLIYALKYNQFRKGMRGMFCGRRNRTDHSDVGSIMSSVQSHP